MASIEKEIHELPTDAQHAVKDFVEFLHSKYAPPNERSFKFDWQGALEPLRDQYTSVEMQHEG